MISNAMFNYLRALFFFILICCMLLQTCVTAEENRGDTSDSTRSVISLPTTVSDSVKPPSLSLAAPPRTEFHPVRLAIVGGGTAAAVVGFHFYQMNAWWKDLRGPFHIQDDWEYALHIDKAGHIYGGYILTHIATSMLDWVGVGEKNSVWFGATLGALYQLYVEFEDGFGLQWGFSPGDAMGDVIGAYYPVAQYYAPVLRNFNFKLSYVPTYELIHEKPSSYGHKPNIMIDDYEGQTYWLSVNVHGLLPEGAKPYWPEWLGFAVGFSVKKLNGIGGGEREFFLSLDYDLTKLPGDGWLWNGIKRALNFIHFPAPAIRVAPTAIYYGLYF